MIIIIKGMYTLLVPKKKKKKKKAIGSLIRHKWEAFQSFFGYKQENIQSIHQKSKHPIKVAKTDLIIKIGQC